MENKRELRVMQATDLSIERRGEGDDERTVITGRAAVFGKWADIGWFKEKIKRGAFRKTIKENDIKVLWNHNTDIVMGRNKNETLTLVEKKDGLWFEAIPPDSATGEIERIEKGYVDECSFAFDVVSENWREGGDNKQDERELIEVRLYEISIGVPFPAYEGTSTTLRSQIPEDMNIDGILFKASRNVDLAETDLEKLRGHIALIESYIPKEPGETPHSEERDDDNHSEDTGPDVVNTELERVKKLKTLTFKQRMRDKK
ncbi:MAG: HK97 family phage prohead protease [Deltaproteobacteria bacterium]|nr:HK97 family phage prohead protease [Deltaproteobacteria bacterium]